MLQRIVLSLSAVLLCCCLTAVAQDNYEIQVYGSETVPPDRTMIELHSNFTADGRKDVENGVLPTESAFHEAVEITHGFTPVFETGFYVFTSARSGNGWQYVGSHIRPRVRAPEEWELPVGVSLSTEFGYQRSEFSEDDWTAEIRPIIDKQIGGLYISVNPTFDYAFHGSNGKKPLDFSPNVKISYDVTPVVTLGVEYYGSLGPVGNFDPANDQQQQIFPSLDLNLSPDFEFNAGLGFGMTPATDHLIAKIILGKRI